MYILTDRQLNNIVGGSIFSNFVYSIQTFFRYFKIMYLMNKVFE